MQRQELKTLTQELRQLALQANATADALERMERFENAEIKWTLSVEEAAVVLDVNVNTVYEYCRQGMIPNRRLGKRVVIPRPALLKWLDEPDAALEERKAI